MMATIRSQFLVVCTVLSVVLAVSSCTGARDSSAPKQSPGLLANPLFRSTKVATASWELKLEPISQPVILDGVALVYATSSVGLSAHAISVATGKQLWERLIHPGIAATGVELTPALSKSPAGKNVAVFLQPAPIPAPSLGYIWWTAPVAVDLQTGKDVYQGPPALISSRPAACDNSEDMCFTTYDPVSKKSALQHVNLTDGTVTSGADDAPLTGVFRLVGEDLYAQYNGDSETLARVAGGKVLWSAEVSSMFGPDATTQEGWTFNYSDDLDLYIGSVGYNCDQNNDPSKPATDSYTVDLTQSKTVGFSASSGKVLWSADGSETFCASGLGNSATKLAGGNGLPVRCEFSRGAVQLPDRKFIDVHASVVGFDPLTGKAKWASKSIELTGRNSLLVPIYSRGDLALVGTARGIRLISTSDGSSRATSEGEVFLCTFNGRYPLPVGGDQDGEFGSGGLIITACLASGEPAAELTIGSLSDVTTSEAGIVVVALENKVIGLKSS